MDVYNMGIKIDILEHLEQQIEIYTKSKVHDIKILENLQELYYGHIYELVNKLESGDADNPFLTLDLEESLLWGTGLSENSESINPVIFFNTQYKEYAQEQIAEDDTDEFTKQIENSIVESKYNNRGAILVYKGDIPFKARKTDIGIQYVAWDKYGELTRLQPIRLIEKIEKCFKEKQKEITTVKVACLGQLADSVTGLRELETYFKNKNQEVQIRQFKPTDEKSVFSDDDYKISLDNFDDLNRMVIDYDLIVLTDNTRFYRRFQSQKNEMEKNNAEYLNVYWNKAQDAKDIWDKNLYYHLLYQTAVNYYAGHNNTMSVKYEFDEQIIKRFEYVLNNSEQHTDIYCYISENNVIANRDISDSNVCRDEYYDGKEVIVYKIEKQEKAEGIVSDEYLFEDIIEDTYIDMWKFVKSIGNAFYKNCLKTYNFENNIEPWKKCKLILKFSEAKKIQDKVRIIYGFKCDEKEILDQARNLFDSMCGLIYKSKYTCVKNYLRNLLSSAIMSRSTSVKSVVFAYLFNSGLPVEFVYKAMENTEEVPSQQLHFKDRKSIYVMLEHLSHMIIRNMEFKEMILMTELKAKYMQDTSKHQFESYLQDIHMACETFGDTKSRIYYYTDNGKEGARIKDE